MKRILYIFTTLTVLLLLVSCNKKVHTVSFDTDGGNEILDVKVKNGEKINEPTDPIKEDYNFEYWTLDGDKFSFETKITKDITLKAKWGTILKHKVTFESNTEIEITEQMVVDEGLVEEPTNLEKEGFVLISWHLDEDLLSDAFDFSNDLVKEDITLYAKWGLKEKVKTKFQEGFRSQLDDHKDVNNADKIGLEPNYFEVKSTKGSTGNNVGIYDEFRFYAGSKLTINVNESFLIESIKISNNQNSFTVKSNGETITDFNNLKSNKIEIINEKNNRQDFDYLEITYYQVGEDVIKEDDINRPEIDISEFQLIELEIGDTFEAPTLTAHDVEDGDVDVLFKEDTVDIHNYGVYYAFYYAIDSDENITEAYITIIVREINQIEDYYENADLNKEGEELKDQLSTILNETLSLKEYGFGNNAIGVMDRDPHNFNNVWLIYNSASIRGDWTGGINWAKEHTWAKSAFGTDTSGTNHSITSTPNNYVGIGTDLHNLRAINPSVNSEHSNYMFVDPKGTSGNYEVVEIESTKRNPFTPGKDQEMTTKAFYPGDDHKGDVARILLYMNIVWDLQLREDIEMLIRWHLEDPVDNFEIIRNELIFSYQGNRNPFIDYPETLEQIYVN